MAVSTNPNTLLGVGTWVAYATGEVLVGIEGSGTFDARDESLGAETFSGTSGSHAISVAEMPAHTHSHQPPGAQAGTTYSSASKAAVAETTYMSSTGGGGGHTHTIAGSTLQPSVTVYIWKRTA